METLDKIIYDLKKEYKNIFKIQIQGEDFIFRPLSKFEYNNLILTVEGDLEEVAEEICELCVFYPKDYDFANPHAGGVTTNICKQIVGYSGYSNEDFIRRLINQGNYDNNNDLSRMMENIILFAFDQFELDDMKNWDIYKLIEVYTRALWVIINFMPDVNLPSVIKSKPPQQSNYGGQEPDYEQIMQQRQQRTMGDNFRRN